jgi:putative transposase
LVCHAYCLMDNHYHIMLETPDANLSIGMRQLNGVYTQRYNRRHYRTGHLFEGRFKAILVQKDSYLLELCRYVVLNPVRAGLAEKPELWRWSSYQATAGLWKEPRYLTTDWILALFGSKKTVARRQFRKFVQEGLDRETPWGKVRGQILLGEEGFVERFKDLLEDKREVKEIPRPQRYISRPSLDKILSRQDAKGQRVKGVTAAHMSYGYTMKEIADYLEIHYTTVSKIIGKTEFKRK